MHDTTTLSDLLPVLNTKRAILVLSVVLMLFFAVEPSVAIADTDTVDLEPEAGVPQFLDGDATNFEWVIEGTWTAPDKDTELNKIGVLADGTRIFPGNPSDAYDFPDADGPY